MWKMPSCIVIRSSYETVGLPILEEPVQRFQEDLGVPLPVCTMLNEALWCSNQTLVEDNYTLHNQYL